MPEEPHFDELFSQLRKRLIAHVNECVDELHADLLGTKFSGNVLPPKKSLGFRTSFPSSNGVRDSARDKKVVPPPVSLFCCYDEPKQQVRTKLDKDGRISTLQTFLKNYMSERGLSDERVLDEIPDRLKEYASSEYQTIAEFKMNPWQVRDFKIGKSRTRRTERMLLHVYLWCSDAAYRQKWADNM